MFQRDTRATGFFLCGLVAVALVSPAASCNRTPTLQCAIRAGVELPPGFALLQSENDALRGASGLTVDGSGTVWTVPEDDRRLLPLSVGRGELRVQGRPAPLDGLDAELDAESITAIGPGRFAIGTEKRGERDTDTIFLVELRDRRAAVTRQIELQYAPWGIRAEDNMGIEGLCHADGRLVAALEPVIERGGKRYAPIGLLDLQSGQWRALELALTTESGKLSGLSCRAGPDGEVQVTAIERHYGVARLLSFSILAAVASNPGSAPGSASRPEALSSSVLLDLAELLHPLPNFEGVAGFGGYLFIISDNKQRVTTGPTFLVRFAASPTRR